MAADVIPMPSDGWRHAGEVLCRAFEDGPLLRAIFPDDTTRPECARAFMTYAARMWLSSGRVIETTPSQAAYMVWEAPGHKDPPLVYLRSPGLLFRYLRSASQADAKRAQDWLEYTEKRRHELLPVPHWYAVILGVAPNRQRYGHGAVLTRRGVARADASGLPAFLETNTESNRRLYEKLGFDVIDSGLDDVLCIPVWRMLHRPDPQPSS